MRPGQQQNKQRMRGRGRKGPNPLSRSYESNGPDVKIRGTAQHIAEKYSTLARDSAASGDRVMAENYLQHAEHYGRIVAAAQGTFQLQQDDSDLADQMDEDGDEDGGNDQSYAGSSNGHAQNGHGQNGQPYSQDRQQDRSQPQERGQYDRNQGGQPPLRDARDGNREMNRDGNRQRDNNGNRENNRDFNRDGNRDNQNRGPREQPNRDGGNREYAGRDNVGRDNPSRDNQGRDNQNRENAGRDGAQRDGNRDNRDGFQPRENRGNRDRQAPNGLGPQPALPQPPLAAEPARHPSPQGDVARDRPVQEQPVVPVDQPIVGDVSRDDLAASGEASAEREPRRRGRPRRTRLQDGMVDVTATPVAVSEHSSASASERVADAEPARQPSAPQPSAPEPKTVEPAAEAAAAAAGPDGEAKVKRKPGRPRKKKPEDDGGDDGGNGHLPAFLMASNG